MRYAVPMSEMNSFVPRLDPIGPRHRIDLEGPLVGAYLGGRPVILARTDPNRPGIQRTVPITISRFQHAIDLEHGRGGYWDGSTPIDDVPLPVGELPGWKGAAALAVIAVVLGWWATR